MIQKLIDQSGISFRELARRLRSRYGEHGVSAATIQRWCEKDGDPRVSEIRMIADYFEVPLSALLPDLVTSDTLSEDEKAALDYFREIRERDGRASPALKVLATLASGTTGVRFDRPPPVEEPKRKRSY